MRIKEVLFIAGIILSMFLFIRFSGFAIQTVISSMTIDVGIRVIYNTFDGDTTHFVEMTDSELETISDLTLERTLYGKIIFNEIINITQDAQNYIIDLDSNVNISNNSIQINTKNLTSFINVATFYLYNLNFSNPMILRNGENCSSSICTIISYSHGILIFTVNVTDSSVYSANETPAAEEEEEEGGGGGNGGGGGETEENVTEVECEKNQDCEDGKACWNNTCVKLFDIDIISVTSPVNLGSFFHFNYLLRVYQNLNQKITVEFWIKNESKMATSSYEIVYINWTGAKAKASQILIPKNMTSGTYEFYIQAIYGTYMVQSHRTIEITVKDNTAFIKLRGVLGTTFYIILISIILLLALIVYFIILRRRRLFFLRYNRRKKKEEEKRRELSAKKGNFLPKAS